MVSVNRQEWFAAFFNNIISEYGAKFEKRTP